MGSVRRRLERLEASSEAAGAPAVDEEHRRSVDDYLIELAIYRGELDPAQISGFEESHRRADEAYAELVDEWKRLGIWGA